MFQIYDNVGRKTLAIPYVRIPSTLIPSQRSSKNLADVESSRLRGGVCSDSNDLQCVYFVFFSQSSHLYAREEKEFLHIDATDVMKINAQFADQVLQLEFRLCC